MNWKALFFILLGIHLISVITLSKIGYAREESANQECLQDLQKMETQYKKLIKLEVEYARSQAL